MKNFLASGWRRQATLKRGGDVEVVWIDYDDAENRYRVEPAHALTPEAIYERRWALGLLDRAVDDLRERYAGRGKAELFDALKAIWVTTRVRYRIASCPSDSIREKRPCVRRSHGCVRTGESGFASWLARRCRRDRRSTTSCAIC
jgi:hypothetical protein